MSSFNIFYGFKEVLLEVAVALIPLVILFIIFQIFFLKLPKNKIINIIKGLALSYVGLALFLQGVHIGFLPAGDMIGRTLGQADHNWVLIPIGLVLGFVATFAEPAVRILNHEVEKASGGYIPQQIMLYTLSTGVAFSIALSMARILIGFSIWYLILPGYLVALVMIRFSKQNFISIAFDSGGVVTGPMTVTFIMAIAIGAASVIEGRDPLFDGFGMIALVALSPILSVLILGLLYGKKEKETEEELESGQ